jgi:inhibitor of KinA sporulation pathway (predicted exonuclease)
MSEIIEIGLCLVDLRLLKRLERHCIMVKPGMSEISEFCTQLTGITPQMVAGAEPLSTAVRDLVQQFKSGDRLFASWGDYDRKQFIRNCRTYDLQYPFGPTHLNVKNLFSAGLGLQREIEIDRACEQLGVTMEGAHHRGVDDAWNIANILCLLLKRMRRAGI